MSGDHLDQIALPRATADVMDQDQTRGRLKRAPSNKVDKTGAWMDEERQRLTAYEYLCHLEETKKWMEQCIEEELPASVELEEMLTNGVHLAKLAKFFNKSEAMRKRKIYDENLSVFKEKGLAFRHTDNINHWFKAMEEVGLPTVFIPTTTDLYDKKNLPRVIYCIHALSHYLHKKGLASRIQDLVGKVEFTEEEISAMQAALKQYGVAMPQFGKIAGVLAQELSEEDVELHAAVIAINEAVLKEVDDETLHALQLPAAKLERIDTESKSVYQRQLLRELLLKRKLFNDIGTNDTQGDDVYRHMLTQEEIQNTVDKINLAKAIRQINTAVRSGTADDTKAALDSPHVKVRNAVGKYSSLYQTELRTAQKAKEENPVEPNPAQADAEVEGKIVPQKEPVPPEDLTLKEIQEIVSRVTKAEQKKHFYSEHEKDVVHIQAVARGHMVRKLVKEEKAKRMKAEADAAARVALGREAKRLRAIDELRLRTKTSAAVKIQRWYRRLRDIQKAKGDEKAQKEREEKVRILQSWVRANQKKKQYENLTKSEAPVVDSIRGFLDLLQTNDEDIADDLELQQLNDQVVQDIRENQRLEQELNVMDVKIGLLVKNRISLDEAMAQSKKLGRKRKEAKGLDTGSGLGSSSMALTKEGRDKMANYQFLFYLLQTRPEYLAKLIFLLPPTATTKFIENVVLSIYNFAQNNREEYLLLKLFKCAIAEEVQKVDDVKEFATGNQMVIKMVVYYNRGVRERLFLRELFAPLVGEVLKTDISINANPIDIYKKWISQTEVETGKPSELPYDVPVPEALKHEVVKKTFDERLQNIMAITDKFLGAICGSTDKLPYGIRAIAMDMRTLLTKKFPSAPSDDIVKVIGNLIFFRYMNPAIVSPDAFDVIEASASSLISPEQRRNLGEISKILQLIASNKRFDEAEQPHLEELNKYIARSYTKIKDFFIKASTTVQPEEHFNIDQYSDLTLLNKPVIYISGKEIYTTHAFLKLHVDEICTSPEDPLRQILADLGDLPDQAKRLVGDIGGNVTQSGPIGSVPSMSSFMGEGEIMLTLNPKLSLPGQDAARARALFVKTKGLVVQVIQCQPGKDLLAILANQATPEQEAAHQKHVEVLKQLREKLQNAGQESSKTTEGIALMLEQSMGTLEDIKKIIAADCDILEKAGLVTKASAYQELLNAIAKDIQNQAVQRKQRKKEIEKLQATLASLREKHGYYDEQISYYQSYLKICMEKMNAGQKPKKPLKSMLSMKSQKPANAQFGSHKVSAKKLYKEGVLIGIEGVNTAMFGTITFVISSTEVGVFQIQGYVGGRKEDEMELQLSDLLQLQYDGVKVHTIKPIKINVNLMIHFLNKKFYSSGP
eukprot:comp22903_c0_seq1/m.36223 comp22903_c0_seq1/g.36223  ORF comp22903_c0_seq1/g.36223 comp22903_c0_seq1/m.36223 type:complete len:1356 (-) comp22903_c0_seq1:111-4178(-)